MKYNKTSIIISLLKKTMRPFNITLTGTSMNPILYDNDIITVLPSIGYNIGDVIVFFYDNNVLIAHRLLQINSEKYYCKGDNSFRIEIIEKEQIVGKVISYRRNNKKFELPQFSNELILLSLRMNTLLKHNNYDAVKTRESSDYRDFQCMLHKLCDKKRLEELTTTI